MGTAPMVLDVSRWNLGGSVGATAAIVLGGCGPVVLSPGQDTESSSDTDSSSVSESESESETDPPTTTETIGGCDDGCPSGYYCDGNACIPYGCADGGCCYEDGCCYYDGCCYGECYYNECYSIDECGAYAICQSGIDWGNVCAAVTLLEECELPYQPTPIPMVAGGEVVALSFFSADGDAARELVVATSDNVTVLAAGTGTPGAPLFAEPVGVVDVATGDLDGDGDEDLAVVISDKPGEIVTWLNDGSGVLTLGASSPLLAARIEIADVDGDGVGDVVGQFDGVGPTDLGVALSVGNGVLGPKQLLSGGLTLHGFDAGELDGGNGREVVAHMSNGTWRWDGGGAIDDSPEMQYWLMTSDEDVPGPVAVVSDAQSGARVARVLRVANMTYVELFDANGGFLTSFGLRGDHYGLITPDLDGVGRDALVFATDGQLTVLRDGTQCTNTLATGFFGATITAAGDFDGDGREDIALAAGPELAVWTGAAP